MPTPSWPGMNGGLGLTGQSPCAAWMSVWHRPEVSMRTRISPRPGCGVGTSSTVSGSVKSWTTAAFMTGLLETMWMAGGAGHRGGCGSEEAQRAFAVADQHVLGLLVVVEHHLVGLAADARLLVAAESGVRRVRVVVVHPDPAGLDTAAEPVRGVRVARPDTGAEAVHGVVGDF